MPGEYIDVRELHPDYRHVECWHCGASWYEKHPRRMCHECIMGQEPRPPGEYVVEGRVDYGRLWYGDVDDRAEYRERYEEETAEVAARCRRRRAAEREVNI